MEARNRALSEWFPKVVSGEIQLPRFQRFEAWGPRNVVDLMQTVIDELPAGSALVLEVGDVAPFKYRPLEGTAAPKARLTELLLDGQQRLTALWRALNDNYADRTFFVRWQPDPSDPSDSEFPVESEARYRRKDGRPAPLWADKPAETFTRGLIPLRLLRPGNEGETEFDSWLAAATTDLADERLVNKIVLKLRARVAQFNLPFLSLPTTTNRAIVLDVFVKLNTRLVRLTPYDVVVAQVEEAAGESLHDLVAAFRSEASSFLAYTEPEEIVLQICALMQDRSPNQAGIYSLDFDRVANEWDGVIRGAARAGEFLKQERILDDERLPTEVVLAPLAALWALAPTKPDLLGNARILLRRYLWRALLTRRYEKAAASSALQDYRAIRDRLLGVSSAEAPIFDEDRYPLPTAEEFELAEWPKSRDRLARATLQMSLLGSADDIADGAEVSLANVGQREYHHLFPVAYLRDGGGDKEAYRALNCALITWRTNRKISAKAPLAYLLERADSSTLGREEVERRLRSHAIDYDSLSQDSYEAFISKRAAYFADGARQLADGKAWRPQVVASLSSAGEPGQVLSGMQREKSAEPATEETAKEPKEPRKSKIERCPHCGKRKKDLAGHIQRRHSEGAA